MEEKLGGTLPDIVKSNRLTGNILHRRGLMCPEFLFQTDLEGILFALAAWTPKKDENYLFDVASHFPFRLQPRGRGASGLFSAYLLVIQYQGLGKVAE